MREAVVEATRRALESDRASWSRTFSEGRAPAEAEAGNRGGRWPGEPRPTFPEAQPIVPAPSPALDLPPAEESGTRGSASLRVEPSPPPAVESAFSLRTVQNIAPAGDRSRHFRILGVLGKLYILMENESGLVLVDQHAAHERILFEEMRRRMEAQGVPSQRLLIPLTIQVSPRDADWLANNLPTLHRAGIALEPFGPATFKIDSLPTFLRGSEPAQLVREIIDELRETSAQTSKLRLGEDMIAKTVCRHAVKANDFLREPELVRLIQDLLACELPYCCPHGRPTMIQIGYGELEKKFGRKV